MHCHCNLGRDVEVVVRLCGEAENGGWDYVEERGGLNRHSYLQSLRKPQWSCDQVTLRRSYVRRKIAWP